MTEIELKASAFDRIAIIQKAQLELQQIQQALSELQTKPESTQETETPEK